MRTQFFATLTVGLLAAACQPAEQARYSYSTTPALTYAVYAGAEQACANDGLTNGTSAYASCVAHERARRYVASSPQPTNQQFYPSAYPQPYLSTYRTDQYGNRIDTQGYRIDAYGNRQSNQG